MRKLTWIAIAALTMVFVACGNQSGSRAEDKTEDKIEDKTTEQVSYITYTNNKYGFSVEVPFGMVQKGENMKEEGTVYVADLESLVFNSIGISGSKNFFDEEYTPEKVREEFEEWIEGKDVVSQECGDDYFTFTFKGELPDGEILTEMYHNVYKGAKVVMVSICYEPDHEEQLGGEVAEHVFNSIKFN